MIVLSFLIERVSSDLGSECFFVVPSYMTRLSNKFSYVTNKGDVRKISIDK